MAVHPAAFDDSEGDTNATPGRAGYLRSAVPPATHTLLARDEAVRRGGDRHEAPSW